MSDIPVDFAFVLDATESMRPVISAARDKVNSIASALLSKYPDGFSFRFSAVGYRDLPEDGLPSETFDFHPSTDSLREWLLMLEAKGGGDVCEDWAHAMALVFGLSWRANALRCVFWIADSPAHGDLYHLGVPHDTHNCDNHADRESLLGPYFAKMAKMNMVFIGLDLGCAWLTYAIAEQIYLRGGGPSFCHTAFCLETGNETDGLAEEIEARAINLVDQTITQTCTFAIGQQTIGARVPTPVVTSGIEIPVDPELIARLPNYTQFGYLARGVYGVVYRAVRSSDSVVVAIKHTEFSDEDLRKFFRREIVALQTLSHEKMSHPTCLSYFDHIEWANEGVLVTPFQRNGTLDTALKLEASGMPYDMWSTKKVIIALGVAFGMEYVHHKGWVHRDLKTANIFLNENFEPIIGDFGLATELHGVYPATGPSMALGTPLHMAPELWVDESVGYTNSVDVYAYAVLLYSLFVRNPELQLDDGKGPAGRPAAFFPRIQQGVRFLRKDTIKASYWRLITACWNRIPNERPQFTAIVNEMVRHINKFLLEGTDRDAVQSYRV
jgi:hypothetical protein